MKTTLHIEGTPTELIGMLKLLENGVDDSEIETEETSSNEPSDEDLFNDLRKSVAAKSQAGKKEQIKKILAKYKVAKLPDLKPEQYAKVKADVDKL
jgi:hypothetical protein